MKRSCGYLLDDVPQITVSGDRHQSIVDRHVVELCRLLVAEERVWYPDFLPAVFTEPDLIDPGAERLESQTRVAPCLSKVHAHGKVLCTNNANNRTRKRYTIRYDMTREFTVG